MKYNIHNVYVGNIYTVVSYEKNEVKYSRTTLLLNDENKQYIDLLANKKFKMGLPTEEGKEYIKFSDGLVSLLSFIKDGNLKDMYHYDDYYFHPNISKRKILELYRNNRKN